MSQRGRQATPSISTCRRRPTDRGFGHRPRAWSGAFSGFIPMVSAEPLPVDRPIESRHVRMASGCISIWRTPIRAQWLRSAELPAAGVTMLLSRDRHQQLHVDDGVHLRYFRRSQARGSRVRSTSSRILRFHHDGAPAGQRPPPCPHLGRIRAPIRDRTRAGIAWPHVAALLELIVEHVADGNRPRGRQSRGRA